jgi:Bacterial regulatory proteins, luxR family
MTAMISDSSSSAHREGKPPARSAGEGTGAQIRDIFARPRPGPGDRPAAGVLRYLQTNLSAREIASELYISVNTVKTHQRHLYRKLGAHSRTQAVRQARALGLLALSA